MTRVRRKAWVAKAGSARFALTLVAALAFFLQSFVTQTHIHAPPSSAAKTVALVSPDDLGKTGKRDRFPANDDPANCPLCQELVHAGHYVTPAFALLVQPSERIAHVVPTAEPAAADSAISHAWRSRAPPTA